MASLEPGREGTCLARLAASTSSTRRSPAGGDRAARVEREQGVRACGVRASGHGRAMRWRGRCAHSRQLGIRPSGSGYRRSSESPSSRARRGSSAAIGHRAREPSGVAAAGHVWGHCSALEVFALHLPPNLCNGAAAVSNEGEVWSGAVAAVCSDGSMGGLSGRPHQLWPATALCSSAEAGEPEPARSMVTTNSVGAVRSKCYLGWSSEIFGNYTRHTLLVSYTPKHAKKVGEKCGRNAAQAPTKTGGACGVGAKSLFLCGAQLQQREY